MTSPNDIARSLLGDLAHISPSTTTTDMILCPLDRSKLSVDPVSRFRALFNIKPKWIRCEIEPFLEDLVGYGGKRNFSSQKSSDIDVSKKKVT